MEKPAIAESLNKPQQDPETGEVLAALESRLQVISAALAFDDLTLEGGISLLEEQAEILNRINRHEDDAAVDYVDFQREAWYGKGL